MAQLSTVIPLSRRFGQQPRPRESRQLTLRPDCHRGRLIAHPVAREMANALGVVVCPDCHRSVALKGRQGTIMRPMRAGWRELVS